MAKQINDDAAPGKLTINDIARLAGVSKKTVSRVINRSALVNEETRTKVEGIIRETRYVPNPQARALAFGRNFLIGLIHDNPNAQMVMNVQQGILEAIRDTDFGLVVRPVDRGSPTMADDIRGFLDSQRLYGVLLLPPVSENDAVAEICRAAGARYVRMGSARLDDDDHMVASNDREAVAEATRHLIELGHSRIGFVSGPHGFRSAAERRAGFEQAIHESGIKLPRSLVADGTYRFDSGIAAGDRLLDVSPRPTAIICSNDEMAAGVMHAARQRGLSVPDDLSLIGFDDTPIAAHIWPPLTTVRWPIIPMARSAALKLLAGMMEDDDVESGAEPSLFLSTLIRRASVAPPRR
jgi:LacI family transcriptional regulator